MENFKINDYVKIKESAFDEEPLIENPKGFQGRISKIEKFESEKLYTVEFDAQSLELLSEEYIIDAIECGDSYLSYYCYKDDLIKTERRDNDELYKKVLNSLSEFVDEIEKDYYEVGEDIEDDFDEDEDIYDDDEIYEDDDLEDFEDDDEDEYDDENYDDEDYR